MTWSVPELDAQVLGRGLDFGPDDALGQTELGDAVDQHAARHMQRLEDRHLMPQLGQVDRAGQARRAGADDGHLLAGGRCRRFRLELLAQGVVAHVAFQPADGDRLTLFAHDAGRFTLRLLRADAAADRRKVVLDLHRLDCAGHVALAQRLDELRNLHTHRAALHTQRLGALQTAFGLGYGVIPRIPEGYFLEVTRAHFRLLRRHLVPRDLHTFFVGKRRHTGLLQNQLCRVTTGRSQSEHPERNGAALAKCSRRVRP